MKIIIFLLLFQSLLFAQNDPYLSDQWNLNNTGSNYPFSPFNAVAGCDLGIFGAWNVTTGNSDIVIAVIDTGVDTTLTEFQGQLVTGWNAFDSSTNVMPQYNSIEYQHGTHMSGLIVAKQNNNFGISGIAPNCKVMPIKAIDDPSGNLDPQILANAIHYAWTHGADILSCSWLWTLDTSYVSNAITEAITYGRNGKGCVFTFVSGNTGLSHLDFPATNQFVIACGGTDACFHRQAGSLLACNGGIDAGYGNGLTVVAPAWKFYTTYINNAFNIAAGTSASTAEIAAVCGLILSVDSNLTWDAVRYVLCKNARRVGPYSYNQSGYLGFGKWNNEMGYGLVKADSTLRYILLPEDVNQDTNVDLTDLILLYNNQGITGFSAFDVNFDQIVDNTDIILVYNEINF